MQDLDRFLLCKHAKAQVEMMTQGQPAASPPRRRPQGLLMLLILLLCVKKGSVPEFQNSDFVTSALNSTPHETECKKLPSGV